MEVVKARRAASATGEAAVEHTDPRARVPVVAGNLAQDRTDLKMAELDTLFSAPSFPAAPEAEAGQPQPVAQAAGAAAAAAAGPSVAPAGAPSRTLPATGLAGPSSAAGATTRAGSQAASAGRNSAADAAPDAGLDALLAAGTGPTAGQGAPRPPTTLPAVVMPAPGRRLPTMLLGRPPSPAKEQQAQAQGGGLGGAGSAPRLSLQAALSQAPPPPTAQLQLQRALQDQLHASRQLGVAQGAGQPSQPSLASAGGPAAAAVEDLLRVQGRRSVRTLRGSASDGVGAVQPQPSPLQQLPLGLLQAPDQQRQQPQGAGAASAAAPQPVRSLPVASASLPLAPPRLRQLASLSPIKAEDAPSSNAQQQGPAAAGNQCGTGLDGPTRMDIDEAAQQRAPAGAPGQQGAGGAADVTAPRAGSGGGAGGAGAFVGGG